MTQENIIFFSSFSEKGDLEWRRETIFCLKCRESLKVNFGDLVPLPFPRSKSWSLIWFCKADLLSCQILLWEQKIGHLCFLPSNSQNLKGCWGCLCVPTKCLIRKWRCRCDLILAEDPSPYSGLACTLVKMQPKATNFLLSVLCCLDKQ